MFYQNITSSLLFFAFLPSAAKNAKINNVEIQSVCSNFMTDVNLFSCTLDIDWKFLLSTNCNTVWAIWAGGCTSYLTNVRGCHTFWNILSLLDFSQCSTPQAPHSAPLLCLFCWFTEFISWFSQARFLTYVSIYWPYLTNKIYNSVQAQKMCLFSYTFYTFTKAILEGFF